MKRNESEKAIKGPCIDEVKRAMKRREVEVEREKNFATIETTSGERGVELELV